MRQNLAYLVDSTHVFFVLNSLTGLFCAFNSTLEYSTYLLLIWDFEGMQPRTQ